MAYEEQKAHDAICDFLESQGFAMTPHVYGVDTSLECISGTEGRADLSTSTLNMMRWLNIGHACGQALCIGAE